MEMEESIRKNLVYLCQNLTNIEPVLVYFIQEGIMTNYEREEIRSERTSFDRNAKLWDYLRRKDVDSLLHKIIHILEQTGNSHISNRLMPKVPENTEMKSLDSVNNVPTATASNIIDEVEDAMAIEPSVSSAEAVKIGLEAVNENAMSLSDFNNFDPINSGTFGSVVSAVNKKSMKLYAIKVTKHDSHREVNSLQKLKHPNVIEYYGSWHEKKIDRSSLPKCLSKFVHADCILMEFCQGNDLSSWVELESSEKTLEHARNIIFQLSVGVAYLHSQDVIHRDLKPANALLLEPYNVNSTKLTVKITDFGYARNSLQESKERQSLMTKSTGTPLYCSPEQEENQDRYDFPFSTDIFPLGMMFYEIMRSTQQNQTSEINEIRKLRLKRGPEMHKDFYTKFTEHSLIRKMLDPNPGERPSSENVVSELQQKWNYA